MTQNCYLCGKFAARIPVPEPLLCEECKQKVKRAKKKKTLSVALLDKIAGKTREEEQAR